jgi:hypothetical protein
VAETQHLPNKSTRQAIRCLIEVVPEAVAEEEETVADSVPEVAGVIVEASVEEEVVVVVAVAVLAVVRRIFACSGMHLLRSPS